MIWYSVFISKLGTGGAYECEFSVCRKAAEGIMRKLALLLVLLSVLFGVSAAGVSAADARGGRTEDCPKGSTDPDCK
jgi:hypothetical protein